MIPDIFEILYEDSIVGNKTFNKWKLKSRSPFILEAIDGFFKNILRTEGIQSEDFAVFIEEKEQESNFKLEYMIKLFFPAKK